MFRRRHIFILVHLLFWLIFAFSVMFSRPGEWFFDQSKEVCVRQIVLLGVFMAVFYLNLYVLIPRFLLQKKVAVYVGIALVIIVGAFYVNSLAASRFYQQPYNTAVIQNTPRYHAKKHFDSFVPGMIALMIGLGITISIIRKWQQELALRQQLEQEKVNTELTMLKAQINPHFFFNTLNTIYSYTLSDGQVARSAIANLSKMMRYVLYEAEVEHTTLNKEIAFIKEYIDLMKLRITPQTTVHFETRPGGEDVLIAPMLFLPFVENAFKHGVSNASEGVIDIQISGGDGCVELLVRNTIHEMRGMDEAMQGGIGLQNTRKRLELLYPGKYTLRTGRNRFNEYDVYLKLLQ